MVYLTRSNWLMQKMYPNYRWNMPKDGKKIYLTFDDGPHPEITSFVLDELKKFNAKATFFCIGKNVVAHPETYKRILTEGHATGNHTHNHLNGWKVSDKEYFDNIVAARKVIDSNLFRPPYGKITSFAGKFLRENTDLNIVMWSVLSGDFDIHITEQRCLDNVLRSAKEGSIIVFHDSEKAFVRMRYALPSVLKHFSEKGFQFEKIVLHNNH